MPTETPAKFEIKRVARSIKKLSMTMFAGYAAAHSQGLATRENNLPIFRLQEWHWNSAYVHQITYGVMGGIIFYLMAFQEFGKPDENRERAIGANPSVSAARLTAPPRERQSPPQIIERPQGIAE